jgi:hypothetical protein
VNSAPFDGDDEAKPVAACAESALLLMFSIASAVSNFAFSSFQTFDASRVDIEPKLGISFSAPFAYLTTG